MELVMGLGIASLFIGAQMWFWAQMSTRKEALEQRLDAELYAERLTWVFQQYIRYANDVEFHGNVNLNNYSFDFNDPTSTGRIRTYTFNTGVNNNASVDTIAVFAREVGQSRIGVPGRSQHVRSGIFFQRPTPTTSGVLYFSDAQPAAADILPSRASTFFPRLVEFRVFNPVSRNVTGGGPRMLSVDMEFVIRKFFLVRGNQPSWCPWADRALGICGVGNNNLANQSFQDYRKTIRLTFRNNNIASNFTAAFYSVAGFTYLFRMNAPAED